MLLWGGLLAGGLLTLVQAGRAPAAHAQTTPVVSFTTTEQTVEESAEQALLTVSLVPTSTDPITLTVTSENGSAVAPGDYLPLKQRLVIAPGQNEIVVALTVVADGVVENDERLTLRLSNPLGAELGQRVTSTIMILDDDTTDLSVAAASAGEGAGSVRFPVALTAVSALTTEVAYQTVDGSALAPADYMTRTGLLLLPPGVTETTVAVPLVDDNEIEPDETLKLVLSGAVNAALAVDEAEGVIVDNDLDPLLTISDTSAVEGGTLVFTLTLDRVSEHAARVRFATEDDTATAPADYETISGVLAIPAGERQISRTVTLVDDDLVEPEETMTLTLSLLEGVRLGRSEAAGRIEDDDSPTVQPSTPISLYLPGLLIAPDED
jgi:hypothetical protein